MISPQEKHITLFRNSLNAYATLTEDSFRLLLSLVRFRKVTKGEYLLHAGQTARKILFVCQGILVSQYVNKDGSTHIKNFFLEGNFAASKVSLLLSAPSGFALECLEDGVVIEMDFKQYKGLILAHDDLKHFYIAYLEHKWIIENEKRQIAFATQTARERYLTFLEDYPALDKRVPQWHIASYLGITPTQLSRIRKELRKK